MEKDLPALKLLESDRVLIIGHRGCCALAPENTLPSFALALECGVDLVELDYQHSKDGIPIVIHDPTLDRTTDARKRWKARKIRVAARTAAEIQSLDAGRWFSPEFAGTQVPLLSEAVAFIQSRGGITLIEHKSGDAETCVQLLREHNLVNRVVLISFDWKFLREVHEMEPEQVLGALGAPIRLTDGRKPRRFPKSLNVRWLDKLAATGAKLVVWNRQVSKASATAARQRGLAVWVYTVDDLRLARTLVERGVRGIITNNPSAIASIRRG